MLYTFSNLTIDQKKDLCNAVYFDCVKRQGDFEVEFKLPKQSKSFDQLKAIYKLFQLALPHFQKWNPKVDWDIEKIKEYAKSELGYTREPSSFEISMMIKQSGFKPKDEEEKQKMAKFCKKIKQNISFADFTKEQAWEFANKFEVWCQEKGWQDVYLDDKKVLNN